MVIAIKYGFVANEEIVDTDGRILGQEAGPSLVRRLLRVFPGSMLVGRTMRHCDGFDMVPLDYLDPADALVINMDVIDSIAVWQTLHSRGDEPRLMNFVWTSPSTYHHPVNYAAIGMSAALFPTFCNSERTASWMRDVIRMWVVPQVASETRLNWVNLGVDTDRVQPRHEPEVPVVLYPAIYLDSRKNPQQFVDVVERVAQRTPLRAHIRLHQRDLTTDAAEQIATKTWADVGPLTPTKAGYWAALAGTTAFLATAQEESYGLEYLEAMLAGAVGVFPDLPWARALLPQDYPFVYGDADQAEAMLTRALTETAECRSELDACVGGDFTAWIRGSHDDDDFARALVSAVQGWFGN